MAFEQKDNSGALFKNEKKLEGSKQPDYTGNCVIEGVIKDISCWVNVSKSGKKYFALSFKEPYNSNDAERADSSTPIEDDLPF